MTNRITKKKKKHAEKKGIPTSRTDLEWPLEYWYPESRTTCRARGNNSSRRVSRAGMYLQICAAASLTDTWGERRG